MDQNQEFAVAQMRRSVHQLGGDTQGLGEPTLMRFLIARSMDPEKAAKMFVQWQTWRKSFVPSGRILESEIQHELDFEKVCLQGVSKDGYPIIIIRGGKHYPSKDQLQFKKFVVYILDTAVESGFRGKEIGNEKVVGILDLDQIYLRNLDPRGLITGFQFLQAYYPERLSKLYVINMPRIFVQTWKLVCRFLEKATQEKILVVSSEEEKRVLVREIGEEALPEEYGGRAKFIPIHHFGPTPPSVD